MEKEIKITPPEGYEIDKENSTFDCIKFKSVKKVLTYEDVAKKLFYKKEAAYINYKGEVDIFDCDKSYPHANNCTSEKQAQKLLAINKLMNVCVFADMRDGLSIEISAELREKIGDILTDKELELIISNDY